MLSAALLAVALSSRVEAVPIADMPNAVRINGEISEAAWQAATPMDGFLQREPEEGGQPTQRTEFRVVYDATTLYVKVRAFDAQPDKIVSYLTRRDADSPSDWLHVFVDSYHDRRTAYEFAVNPAGVKIDRYWFNDNNRDDGWDAVWDAKVSRDAGGWTAEFHIPFSQLRFNPNGANTFGFAVARRIGRLNETSTWPLLARSATGYVSSFGEMGGLATTVSPKRLEMLPYTVADLTRRRAGGNPLVKASLPSGAMGLDLKYALTPGLTLTTTVNPDFGQVEADPAVVNLSAFETFFTERRPFFVEGSGTFRFDSDCMDGPCQLFYSRRIGRSPQGTGELPSGDNVYTQSPTQTTILGAAKLTGRVGKFSIGGMSAVTQEEFGTVRDGTHTFERPIEPLATYSIGRVRREFANQSSLGFMVTSSNRHLTETTSFLPSSAVTGGVDFARRRERPRRHQQDRRSARPVQFTDRVQIARLRAERRGIPPTRRRALDGELVPGAQRRAEPLVPQSQSQLQPVGRLELFGRSLVRRRERQRQRDVRQQLVGRRRHQPSADGFRRSIDARRSGWIHGGVRHHLVVAQLGQPTARVRQLFPWTRVERRRLVVRRRRDRSHVSPDVGAHNHERRAIEPIDQRLTMGR